MVGGRLVVRYRPSRLIVGCPSGVSLATTARQAGVARSMYEEIGDDGKRKYTVAEIAETFAVSRKPSTGTSNRPVAAARRARRPRRYATLAMSIHHHLSRTRPLQ